MELWNHQKLAIEKAISKQEYALLFEPGTGKSATIITILRNIFTNHGHILKTLIICPTVVCDNWLNEWAKFSKIPKDKIAILEGSASNRMEMVSSDKYSILVCNYQTMLMPRVMDALVSWGIKIIIADESHRLKTPGSKTTKAAITLANHCNYRYILTGTPILKNLMDFYSQFKFLDGGKTFGSNFSFFKSKYFYDKNANAPAHVTWPDWQVRPNATQEVSDLVYKKASYAEKSQCLDLPPLLKKRIFVDLTPKQVKAYREMENLFITQVGAGVATAQIALTMGLRLMQITSGFISIEVEKDNEIKKTITKFEDNPKADALREILEDIAPHHKVIVWACFKEDYGTIREVCEKLGLGTVELHGETKDRKAVIDAFQNDGAVRVLIGNQGAGGIGVNLTAASYAVYYSRSFSLEHDIQSEARNYRGGSEIHTSITRVDIIGRMTIDEKVLEALEAKQNISDEVLKGMIFK